MFVKTSCNGVTLLNNKNKLNLDDKKGAILEIIAYMIFRPEKEKEVLRFKLIGSIKQINSDTDYKIDDFVITSDEKVESNQVVYNENENLSECFYSENKNIFPEGFYEEIFVSEEELKTDYRKTCQKFAEKESILKPFRTYYLTLLKDAFKELITSSVACSIVTNKFFTRFVSLDLGDINSSNTVKINQGNIKIELPKINYYNVSDTKNKHKCLETDEEFEKNCSETYSVKNSMFCLPMKDKDLIQSVIYRNRSYWDDKNLLKVDEILKDEAIILDIGSNIGNHSLYWANERNAKKIYAFEPYPYTYKILEKNVKINNLEERMKIFPFGLSDEETKGTVTVFCDTNIGGTNFVKNKDGDFDFKTLDSLNIEEKIDLIKIDVEGHEIEVLKGGIKTIERSKPIILVESFHSKDMVEEILFPMGYELYDNNKGTFDYIYCCKDNA